MSKYAIRNGGKVATDIPAAAIKQSGNRENREWKEGILNKAHKAVDEIFTSALKEVFNQVMEGAKSFHDGMDDGEWHTLTSGIGKTEVQWDEERRVWTVLRTVGSGRVESREFNSFYDFGHGDYHILRKDKLYSEMIKELWRDLSDELTHKGHNEEYSPTVTPSMMEGSMEGPVDAHGLTGKCPQDLEREVDNRIQADSIEVCIGCNEELCPAKKVLMFFVKTWINAKYGQMAALEQEEKLSFGWKRHMDERRSEDEKGSKEKSDVLAQLD